MLSNVDIVKELNKNIYIYPIPTEIRGSSINLTASKWAWSLRTKQSIVNQGKIRIPASDSALIETEEIIHVTSKISGTYHSKVSLVSKGSGHIGTTLDPAWCGHSLITVHNHSEEDIEIDVGTTFATLIFYYNKSRSTKQSTNISGQTEILREIGITNIPTELTEEWKKNSDDIIRKCNENSEITKLSTLRKDYRKVWFRQLWFLLLAFPFSIAVIGIIIYFFESFGTGVIIKPNGYLDWFLKVGLSGVVATYFTLVLQYINEN